MGCCQLGRYEWGRTVLTHRLTAGPTATGMTAEYVLQTQAAAIRLPYLRLTAPRFCPGQPPFPLSVQGQAALVVTLFTSVLSGHAVAMLFPHHRHKRLQ